MNIFGGRKIVVAIIGFVADTALAGIVPYWTVTVLVAYFDEKLEEKGIGLSKVVSMLK
jgi:predicted TIM-barrel enzyme